MDKETVIRLLSVAFLILYIVVWTVALVGTLTIYFRYSRTQEHHGYISPPPSPPPRGVSILRPMKGLDPQLEECLESAFRQNYPKFEILLSVADGQDPAVEVAQRLIEKYPRISARLIIGTHSRPGETNAGAEDIGPNPKINNLIKSYSEAKYDIIWILDANTHVPPSTLSHSVGRFLASNTPRPIQLIHHLPVCVINRPLETTNWGALLEETYLSTSHAKFYVSINKFGIAPCVMGKSNLFHKSSLDKATAGEGLAKFAQYIAEDHLIADTLWYHTPNPGPNHAMTRDIARQPVQSESLATYFERRIRWIRVRKYMVTSATLIEPFTECFLASIYGSFALRTLFGYAWRKVVFWHVWIWLLVDLFQFHTLHSNSGESMQDAETPEFARGSRPWTVRRLGLFFICWIIREATCLPIWIVAIFGRPIVNWRNRQFKVRRDMTVVELR